MEMEIYKTLKREGEKRSQNRSRQLARTGAGLHVDIKRQSESRRSPPRGCAVCESPSALFW